MISSDLRFTVSTASIDDLVHHLHECDQEFKPALSSYVDVHAYAAKVKEKAILWEVWSGDLLAGLLAGYPDRKRRTIFITNLSVIKELQGKGISGRLLGRCIQDASAQGFVRMELEVWRANGRARAFYNSKGFKVIDGAEKLRMEYFIPVE